MEFEIEAWEVPPGADAANVTVPIEFGPVEWNGVSTRISARMIELGSGEMLAFFHSHQSTINFVVLEGLRPYLLNSRTNSKTLGRVIREAIAGRQLCFGRVFYVEGEICLLREGKMFWVGSNMGWQETTPIEPFFDAVSEPSARVSQWLQSQWHDTDSQVRFSWEWNRKDFAGRDDWLGDVVPRWRELGQLMRAVATIAQLPPSARWILDHFDTHNHAPELLARLQPWRELFVAHFLPFAPLPRSYPEFVRDYFQFISNHVQVWGQDTSSHQQLEARLYLRDWLQTNAPDHLDLVQ